MPEITISCEMCSGTGDATHGDRHTGTNMDRCRTCGGTGQVPARPGEARETSWPFAVPGAERPADKVEAPDPDTSASAPIQILYAEPDQPPTVRTILLPVSRGELSHGPEGWWFAALDVEAREWRRILMSGIRAWGSEAVAAALPGGEVEGLAVDHEFKGHPSVFGPLARGEKTFEFRKDDRPGGYHVGQTIRVSCYDPEVGYLDVPPVVRRITNILRPGEFGLQEGYCILSLAVVRSSGGGEKNKGASPSGSGSHASHSTAAQFRHKGFDPSRVALNIVGELADMKVGAIHKRTSPFADEYIVGWKVKNKEGFRGLQFMLAVEDVLSAQAMEARQGGDAEGGSVEDDSAVRKADVPASIDQVLPAPARQEEGSRGDAPEGWVLLPRRPTQEMLAAGRVAADAKWNAYTGGRSALDGMEFFVRDGYRAMVSAAPTPDANSGGEAPDRDKQTAQFIAESDAAEAEERQLAAAELAYRAAFINYDRPDLGDLRHRVSLRAALKAARKLSAAPHPSQEKGEADA